MGKRVLEYIYDAAYDASKFLNRQKPADRDGTFYDPYDVTVHLLTPKVDKINQLYQRIRSIFSVDNEDDVLSRYMKMAEQTDADYVVRLTGDCLHMPIHMISRVIKTAVIKKADYASNIIHRTSPEGFDVEAMSIKMLNFLNDETEEDMHMREHVSLYLVQDILKRPEFYKKNFKIWHLFEHYDFSAVKTSLDIPEEFQISKRNMESVHRKKMEAKLSGFISE